MAATHIKLGERTFKVEFPANACPLVDGIPMQVDLQPTGDGTLSLLWTDPNHRTWSLRCVASRSLEGPGILVDGVRSSYTVFDPRSLRASASASGQSGPQPLKAPMPGRVVRILVAAGDRVEAGQGCLVIEAMKMQNELRAPRSGSVTNLSAVVGQTVASGTILLVVE